MDARERLFAALRGEPVDRTPIWLLFPHHRLGCYVDVRQIPAYQPVVAAIQRAGITLDRRSHGVRVFAPEVADHTETERLSDGTHHRRTISWRGRRLVAESHQRDGGSWNKPLLVEDEDLAFFCALPLNDDETAIRAELAAKRPQMRREHAAFPRHLGATMFAHGEPINPLYQASDLESLSVWSLTHSDLIEDWLRRRMATLRPLYRWSLEQGIADCYFLVGSELAAPPMVSTACFERWIVPFCCELIAMIRTAGRFAIQHFHGQIRELLPFFRQMAPDALHTIEAPPVGNCSLTQAYEGLGDGITLIGNVQYDDFRSDTPERMRERVTRLLEEVAGRRFILSPSAGPFDPEPSQGLIENYLAFIEAGSRYGAHAPSPIAMAASSAGA